MNATRVIRLIPLLVVISPSAFAQEGGRFDGIWRTSPTASCTYTGEEGGGLKIEADTLYGVETTCDMTDPVQVRNMDAVLYDMRCSDETREWQDRAMMMDAADGGLYLIWNGYAFKYQSCQEDDPSGTVTRAEDLGITE